MALTVTIFVISRKMALNDPEYSKALNDTSFQKIPKKEKSKVKLT